jgi:hypothetical protein
MTLGSSEQAKENKMKETGKSDSCFKISADERMLRWITTVLLPWVRVSRYCGTGQSLLGIDHPDRRWRESELFGFVLQRVARGQPFPYRQLVAEGTA